MFVICVYIFTVFICMAAPLLVWYKTYLFQSILLNSEYNIQQMKQNS